MKIQHKEDYRQLRAAAYPKLGDQMDAIYKLAKSLGTPLPPDVEAWIAQIDAVKQKYPKPL